MQKYQQRSKSQCVAFAKQLLQPKPISSRPLSNLSLSMLRKSIDSEFDSQKQTFYCVL